MQNGNHTLYVLFVNDGAGDGWYDERESTDLAGLTQEANGLAVGYRSTIRAIGSPANVARRRLRRDGIDYVVWDLIEKLDATDERGQR